MRTVIVEEVRRITCDGADCSDPVPDGTRTLFIEGLVQDSPFSVCLDLCEKCRARIRAAIAPRAVR